MTLNPLTDVVHAWRLTPVHQGVQNQALIEQTICKYPWQNVPEHLQASFTHLDLKEEKVNELTL